MKVSISYIINADELGLRLGVSTRDLECLAVTGITDFEFTLFAPLDSDGCLDGHVEIDTFEVARQMDILSRGLPHQFCTGSYKLLSAGMLDDLRKYSESDEAIVDIHEAYCAELMQMEYDAACARAERDDR